MKFSTKDLLSKFDQIRRFLRIWSHLLSKSLMENFIFCAVLVFNDRRANSKQRFQILTAPSDLLWHPISQLLILKWASKNEFPYFTTLHIKTHVFVLVSETFFT